MKSMEEKSEYIKILPVVNNSGISTGKNETRLLNTGCSGELRPSTIWFTFCQINLF